MITGVSGSASASYGSFYEGTRATAGRGEPPSAWAIAAASLRDAELQRKLDQVEQLTPEREDFVGVAVDGTAELGEHDQHVRARRERAGGGLVLASIL